MKTYAELLAFLQKLTPQQLAQTATISMDVSEEAVAVNYFHITQADDKLGGVLDEGHVILAVNF